MSKRIIRVLWADDEEVYNEEYMPWECDQYQIKLVAGVQDAEELKAELVKHSRLVDAVIVDANFADKGMPSSERTGSGLTKSNELRAKYGEGNKTIPFFLFTGRSDDVLNDMFGSGSGLLDYFKNNNQKFSKLVENSTKRLFDRIFEVVTELNTPEFRIYNEYAQEFDAAKLIDGATENLQRGLLYLYEEDSWKDVQDFFNPARKIVERIVAECEKMKILPPKSSLNNASKLFSGMVNDNHERLKEEVMMRPLAESLFHFLKITQDGSHDANDMSLGVDKYVRQTKNINLYRSILYIAMDILLWFKNIHEKYQNNTTPLWEEKYDYEGKVFVDVDIRNKKYFYTSKYELQTLADNDLKYGDIVRIYTSESSIHPKGKITEYVKKGNYRRL